MGFSIRGSEISLSKSRLKTFKNEIDKRTIKNRKTNIKQAVNSVNNYLYKGCDGYCFTTSVLTTVNCMEDIQTMNDYILDALRAVVTGNYRIGGLGLEVSKKKGCITRGKGKNVKHNRVSTEKELEYYKSLMFMRNALLSSRALYDLYVRLM